MATVIKDLPHRGGRQYEAKFLFAIGFAYFLIAACVLRLMPRAGRSRMMPTNGRKGPIGEAMEAASSFVGFAYMR